MDWILEGYYSFLLWHCDGVGSGDEWSEGCIDIACEVESEVSILMCLGGGESPIMDQKRLPSFFIFLINFSPVYHSPL